MYKKIKKTAMTPTPKKENEKTLEKKLREKVARLGGLAVKLIASSFTGLPDRLVLIPGGRIWFVELKSGGKKPSPRQEIVIALLRRLGFTVWIVDSEEKLKQFFDEIHTA